jgi:endo-1,4-beta-xylanase
MRRIDRVVLSSIAVMVLVTEGRPAMAQAAGFVPQPILPGGQIVTLFPPDSPYLKRDRIAEPEQNNLQRTVPGRIQSIVNIHNPSIEVHVVDPSNNTGAAVILVPGGGHNTLNVGTEGADLVSYFYNYGVTTVILRNRLKRDGYDPLTDEVRDAQQAVRVVRARAKDWNIDPNKIGMMGFSAGAELVAPAAIAYEAYEQANRTSGDPLSSVSARPDFVALVYPGPTPFARDPATPIPRNAPPSFITCAGSGDAVHAVWADEYFGAMLKARVPNLEMHIYGNGVHANGLKDREGTPFGTWQDRFVDWFRDLGFLGKPGVETKAARDVAAHVTPPVAPK